MAPSASDPKDLKMILNPARRRALSKLIDDIISYMRYKIEQSFDTKVSPKVGARPPLVDHSSSANDKSTSYSPSSGDPEAQARQERLQARLDNSYSTPRLRQLKRDALLHFDKWANEVIGVLKKACEGPEDPRSEQRRKEWMAARNSAPPPYTSIVANSNGPEAEAERGNKEVNYTEDISLLQSLYHPIQTRLTTISKEDKTCTLSCMVLILLSLGHYSSYSRTLLCHVASSFAVPLSILTTEETEIARSLILATKTLTADAETQKRQAENASSRRWKVGLASIAGAAVIGITGGLAAPVVAGAIGGIMGGVGLGGVASFLGIFFMNGALVGSLFGAYGAKMTGEMVDQYARDVSDFKFIPIVGEWGELSTREDTEVESRRLRVTIGVNGWLKAKDDVTKSWRVLGCESEVFALRYEMDALLELGNSMQAMVASYAWSFVKVEILKRTVLATLWYAMWPLAILKMATSIDNPFSVARNRSEKAGEVLADALINKAQGERPVTLIGYSLGSRVIYSCLKSLAERKAFGLIESVVFIGAPVPSDSNNWKVMRSVVSGRIINVYSENDYILAFLYRATSIQLGVAGLQAIEDVEGIVNLNLSREVSGHLRYPDLIGKILKRAGFEGVLVENTEIEEDRIEIQSLETSKGMGNHENDLIELEATAPVTNTASINTQSSPKTKSTDFSNQQDLLGLFGDENLEAITRPGLAAELPADNEIDHLARGIADMSMGMDTDYKPPSRTPTRATEAPTYLEFNSPPRQVTTPGPPGTGTNILFNHHEEQLRRGMLDITEGLACTQLEDLPPSDSDSGDGGIQMVDNETDSDSEGELTQLDCSPIPDDEYPVEDIRDMAKVSGFFEEQKSLSTLKKGNVCGSAGGSAGGSVNTQIQGINSSGTGDLKSPKRVRASDMGLY